MVVPSSLLAESCTQISQETKDMGMESRIAAETNTCFRPTGCRRWLSSTRTLRFGFWERSMVGRSWAFAGDVFLAERVDRRSLANEVSFPGQLGLEVALEVVLQERPVSLGAPS